MFDTEAHYGLGYEPSEAWYVESQPGATDQNEASEQFPTAERADPVGAAAQVAGSQIMTREASF